MDKTKLSVSLFILSESIFFIFLILAYVLFHGRHLQGLDAHAFLNVPRTGFFTGVLLSSSVTMMAAMAFFRREKFGLMALFTLITIILGAVFLYGQGSEWWGLIQQDVTISRDLFGATFFTLTGFHGFHVLVGLIMLTIVWGFMIFGKKPRPKETAVDTISLYWHFVDAVWIVVFTVIYLWK